MEQDEKFDIPRGLSNPWKFVQKRIIFENKINMTEAFSKYHKIYARGKENDGLLQECIVTMRQLYIEIKEIIKKNKKCKNLCKETIDYMNRSLQDHETEISSDDFPEIYKHYIGLMDMLVFIGLTDIESKNDDPGEAIISTDA